MGMLLLLFLVAAVSGQYPHEFIPSASSTFLWVSKNGPINVTFLDGTNLAGFDGSDIVRVGGYTVISRFCMIQRLKSHDFDQSDGILGFGASEMIRSASLLKTLSSTSRPSWDIVQPPSFHPMPRVFSFTASQEAGELYLGGYDPASIVGEVQWHPMVGEQYGVNVTSVTFAGVELLNFKSAYDSTSSASIDSGRDEADLPTVMGVFDSGTTCTLLPNSTWGGLFTESPFLLLQKLFNQGHRSSLVVTMNGLQYAVDGCVDPFSESFILGDPWFRKHVIIHDVQDYDNRRIGLGVRDLAYPVGVANVEQPQKLSATRTLHEVALSREKLTYNIPVTLGTPPQSFNLIFDTGSYLLAVFSQPPAGSSPMVQGPVITAERSFSERLGPGNMDDNYEVQPLLVRRSSVQTLLCQRLFDHQGEITMACQAALTHHTHTHTPHPKPRFISSANSMVVRNRQSDAAIGSSNC